MTTTEPRLRRATMADLPALGPLIAASARELSRDDYTPEQVEGALRGAFGTDTQLIRDGSYFVIEVDGRLAGCGGGAGAARCSAATRAPTAIPPSWIRPGTPRKSAHSSSTRISHAAVLAP